MEILLAGNTGYLTEEFILRTFPQCHVLISGDTVLKTNHKKNITVLPFLEKEDEKGDILASYEFDRIIYFSQYLTFHGQYDGEMERLRRILQYCKGQENSQMLYVAGPEGNYTVPTGKTVLAKAAEDLCLHFNEVKRVPVKILRAPYLYSASYEKDYFYRLFQTVERKKEIIFPEYPKQKMYFLCMEDLSELIYRILDNWDSENEILNVPDYFGVTFEDLGEAVKKWNPQMKIRFLEEAEVQELKEQNRELRRRYGWFPKISVLSDFQDMAAEYDNSREKKSGWQERLKAWSGRHREIEKALELVLGFGAAEVLTRVSGGIIQFRMIDFRLLFVVILGTIHGMDMGIGAAGLASLSLFAAYLRQGTKWVSLFYEPFNWIPFIAYFITGAICGYVRLKSQDALQFMKKENILLKEKFLFMKNVYQDILQEKRGLKKQILVSRDSFGKIFDITRQLDAVQPQEIFIRAIRVMEEVLENRSISIYSLGKYKQFARLETASKDIFREVPRSLKMDTYTDAMDVLKKDEIWVNRGMREDYPMYMVGIRRQSEVVMLIQVHHVKYEQMTLYYQNLFKILCGLIETALLRALDYQEALRDKQYLKGLIIMKEEYFREKLKLHRSMLEEKTSEHTLVQIDRGHMTLEEAEKLLRNRIRENDTLGILSDGMLYLILNQASAKDAGNAIRRLEELGFRCRIVPQAEEAGL